MVSIYVWVSFHKPLLLLGAQDGPAVLTLPVSLTVSLDFPGAAASRGVHTKIPGMSWATPVKTEDLLVLHSTGSKGI